MTVSIEDQMMRFQRTKKRIGRFRTDSYEIGSNTVWICRKSGSSNTHFYDLILGQIP